MVYYCHYSKTFLPSFPPGDSRNTGTTKSRASAGTTWCYHLSTNSTVHATIICEFVVAGGMPHIHDTVHHTPRHTPDRVRNGLFPHAAAPDIAVGMPLAFANASSVSVGKFTRSHLVPPRMPCAFPAGRSFLANSSKARAAWHSSINCPT